MSLSTNIALIIYLDVAHPTALVVIDKASEETGPLDSKVRAFIQDSLHLRTEIPGLRILDDGTVFGGMLEGRDVLAPQTSMKADAPGVVVGPDSVPTLSVSRFSAFQMFSTS